MCSEFYSVFMNAPIKREDPQQLLANLSLMGYAFINTNLEHTALYELESVYLFYNITKAA